MTRAGEVAPVGDRHREDGPPRASKSERGKEGDSKGLRGGLKIQVALDGAHATPSRRMRCTSQFLRKKPYERSFTSGHHIRPDRD